MSQLKLSSGNLILVKELDLLSFALVLSFLSQCKLVTPMLVIDITTA